MSNNSNLRIWTPVLLGGAMALGIFFGSQMSNNSNRFFGKSGYSSDQKIQDIINIIDQQYVDSVNKEELLEQQLVKCFTN